MQPTLAAVLTMILYMLAPSTFGQSSHYVADETRSFSYPDILPYSPSSLDRQVGRNSASLLNHSGIILGFADFDANRRTDILILNLERDENGSVLLDLLCMFKDQASIFSTPTMDTIQRLTALRWLPPNNNLKSIRAGIPSDFNADSLIDLLLLVQNNSDSAVPQQGPYELWISYQNPEHKFSFGEPIFLGVVLDHPLLLDYNADGTADLILERQAGITELWLGHKESYFEQSNLTGVAYPWAQFGYSAFVDAEAVLRPGIFLTLNKNNDTVYHFYPRYYNGSFGWDKPVEIQRPNGTLYAAPVFADWKQTGGSSFLQAYCEDYECLKSNIALFDFEKKQWSDVNLNWTEKRLQRGSENPLSKFISLPQIMPLRKGDFTLNHFSDALTALISTKVDTAGVSTPFLLQNEQNGFKWRELTDIPPGQADAILFDFNEDGVLGVWTISSPTQNNNDVFVFGRYASSGFNDRYFLKVMMLNGLCEDSSACPLHSLPYGLPMPGATVYYSTEDDQGDTVKGRGFVLTSTAYQALQLPFITFGLGDVPNYVESLKVSLPTMNSEARVHEFTFIVPKTQLVIVPYPLKSPSKWKSQLFMNPFDDLRIIYVAAVFLVIGILVCMVLLVLQYREIRQDELEKKQDPQKFNFDAMKIK